MAKKTLSSPIATTGLDASQINDTNKEVANLVQKWEQFYDLQQKQLKDLEEINGQYGNLNEILISMNNQQMEIAKSSEENLITVEELNQFLKESDKALQKILKTRELENDLLTGTTKIQAKLNADISESQELAKNFAKIGTAAFLPKTFEPFMQAFSTFNQKMNMFSADYKMRKNLLSKEINSLKAEGKILEAAALELNESGWKKTFDVIEGFASKTWEIGSFIFNKLFNHLKFLFNTFMDIAKKLISYFLDLPEVFLTVTKSAFMFQKTMMEYMTNISQSIIAIPLNILEKAQEIGYEIKKETAEFAQAFENIQKDFRGGSEIGKGLQSIQGQLIGARKEFMNVNSEAVHLFGRGIQGINKGLAESSEMVKSLSVFSSIFANQIVKNKENLFYYYKMKQTFNLADDDMQFLARRAFVTGKGLADVYDVIEKSISAAAKVHRQDSKQMSKDFFELRKNIVDFGHISSEELANVVGRIRQMGVETKEAAALFQKIQTFEDAANMASQLSQSFNMVVDSMSLLKAESPDQMLQMLRDSMFSTGRSFDQLNRFEKSLLQQQTGLSSEAMQALFSYQNLGKSYDEIMQEMEANDPTKLQLQAMQQLRDTVVEMKEVMPKFQNSFEAFFTGLKDNVLISSSLRKDLEGISLSFDDLYNLGLSSAITAFVPALTAISKVINNIKTTLTDAKFVSTLTKVSSSVANIIEHLFNFDSTYDISNDIDDIITNIQPMFEKLFDTGFNFIRAGIQIFINSLPLLVTNTIAQFQKMFGKGGFFETNFLHDIKALSQKIINEFKVNASYFQTIIIGAFRTMFSFTNEFIKIGANIAGEVLKGIANDLASPTNSGVILTSFKELINGIMDNFIGQNISGRRAGGLLKQILGFDSTGKLDPGSINTIFKNIYNTLYPLMTDIVYELSFIFDELIDYLANTLSYIAGRGITFFQSMFNDPKWNTIFSNIGHALTTFISGTGGKGGIMQSLMTIVQNFLTYLNTTFTAPGTSNGLVSLVLKALGEISKAYFDFYKAIYMTFIKDLIKNNIGIITSAVSVLVGYFIAKSQLLGSTLTAAITRGADLHVAGIQNAFKGGATVVQKAIEESFRKASNMIRNSIRDATTGEGIKGKKTFRRTGSKGEEIIEATEDMILGSGKMGSHISKYGSAYGMAATVAGSMMEEGMLSNALQYAGTGATLGSFFGPWGTAIGAGLGGLYGAFQDGYISKDGKVVKVSDNDHIIAMKDNGPIAKGILGNQNTNQSIDIKTLTNELSIAIKEAVQVAIVEGFKAQNHVIEVKLNGEKVGEGLLASGFTNMMSNANKTKGNPTINPNSIIYRDGQIPSSGYINS